MGGGLKPALRAADGFFGVEAFGVEEDRGLQRRAVVEIDGVGVDEAGEAVGDV
jgi:hypothetical protein